ncbi:MAG: helix-turn-helix domain-containing protein [Pseudolabrys sp.]|nr:helix-turn-helix domain-containing protein [Pseudolabrys sp.]
MTDIANGFAARSILPAEFADRTTLTVEEAAKVLGISRASGYAAARERTLPTVKIGRRLLVARVALERLLNGA